MQLYLIRHGQSLVNVRSQLDQQPSMDAGLTEVGFKQARALAQWLPGEVPQIHALYTSTLLRARQTSQILAEIYGCEMRPDDRLREIGSSFLDHLPVTAESLPQNYEQYLRNYFTKSKLPYQPIAHDVERSESYMHFRVRIGAFVDDLTRLHLEETVLVVCHEGVINAVFDHVFNIGPYRTCHIFNENTGITHLVYSPHPERESWGLRFQNRTEHLKGIIGE